MNRHKIHSLIGLATIGLVLLLAGPSAQADEGFDFRRVNWGMSQEEVKKAETKSEFVRAVPPNEINVSILTYKVILNNSAYFLRYAFMDDRLCNAGYSYDETPGNKNIYLEEHKKLKASLSKVYGEPKSDNTEWSSSLFKDNPEKIGLAYSLGNVRTLTGWENDKTLVRLNLDGGNAEINLGIFYYGRQFIGELNQREEKSTLNDL